VNGPLVTVLLTSYNQGRWLREAIESVLAQTYREWELLLIDNGSTDHSPAIIEEYRAHPRITVVRHDRNRPHTVISNEGICRARGQYLSFLYSDDYYLPNKLERQVSAFEGLSEQFGVVYSAGYRLTSDGVLHHLPCETHRGDILAALLTRPQFFQPIAPLVRRACLLKYPFNEQLFMEGEGIFAKIAMRYLFHPLQEPLGVMRDHDSNMGKEIAPNLARNIMMYEALFAHPDFPASLQSLRGQALGGTYRIGGWEAIRRERNYDRGREWLRAAVRCNPALRRDPRVAAGLLISSLPRPLADVCNRLLNGVAGAPAPPVKEPPTPAKAEPSASINERPSGAPVPSRHA
jgi:glycosyltransferase involved in cell wall biosynthesis